MPAGSRVVAVNGKSVTDLGFLDVLGAIEVARRRKARGALEDERVAISFAHPGAAAAGGVGLERPHTVSLMERPHTVSLMERGSMGSSTRSSGGRGGGRGFSPLRGSGSLTGGLSGSASTGRLPRPVTAGPQGARKGRSPTRNGLPDVRCAVFGGEKRPWQVAPHADEGGGPI